MLRRRRRRSLVLLASGLLLATCAAARAEITRTPLAQLVTRRWSTEEGLPQSSVNALLQSRDGYLWVGTFGGLARFDGLGFTSYGLADGLPSTRVLALLEDGDDTLWLGTQDGGLAYRRASRGDERFTPIAVPSSPTVWALLVEPATDELWVATDRGVLATPRRRPGAFRTLAGLDLPAAALVRDATGAIWVGSHGGGVLRFDGHALRAVTAPAGTQWVLALAADRDGTMWALTRGGLLHGTAAGLALVASEPRPLAVVGSMLVDRSGALWLGSHGVQRYVGSTLEFLRSPADTARQSVRALLEDREGSIWVGLDGGGLLRLRDGPLVSYGEEQGLVAESALPIREGGDGALYVGAPCRGLFRLDGDRFAPVIGPAGESLDCVRSLLLDGGTLWAGEQGIVALDPHGWRHYGRAQGLAGDLVFTLASAGGGALWVGSEHGVQRFDGARFAPLVAGVPVSPVTALLAAGDTLWAGTAAGLTRVTHGSARTFTPRDGLPPGQVRALYLDRRGVLWVGTYGGGLGRVEGDHVATIGRAQGLYDDVVSTILPDAGGELWMCGNRGIFRVHTDELDAVARGRLTAVRSVAYGIADGMRSRECNGGGQPAGWRDARGRLWFPTIAGVVMADPRHPIARVAPPPVLVESLVAGGRRLVPGGRLTLPTGVRAVEIHYVGLSFVAAEKLRFRYRLSPFDDGWVDAEGRRAAFYAHLPAGRYRFEVMAANENGDWSAPASVTLDLPRRPWETGWFFALSLLAGAALLWTGDHLRVRRLVRQEEALAALVAERTRELVANQEALAALNANLATMVNEQTEEIRQTRDLALLTLAKLAELRDGATGRHIERIAAYCRCLAVAASRGVRGPLGGQWITQLERSSPLHDIGKVAVPDAILRKAGPLTPEEWQVMRTHAAIGGETLRAVQERHQRSRFLQMAAEIAHHHHERWDGRGYPDGIAGEQIPLAARIVALADAYDAITSERPYKPAFSHEEACRRIVADRGMHFDPAVVDAFLAVEAEMRAIQERSTRGDERPAAAIGMPASG